MSSLTDALMHILGIHAVPYTEILISTPVLAIQGWPWSDKKNCISDSIQKQGRIIHLYCCVSSSFRASENWSYSWSAGIIKLNLSIYNETKMKLKMVLLQLLIFVAASRDLSATPKRGERYYSALNFQVAIWNFLG